MSNNPNPPTTADPQAKITQQELVDMFGSQMPIEAVDLLWNAPDEMTIGEARAKLREIANAR